MLFQELLKMLGRWRARKLLLLVFLIKQMFLILEKRHLLWLLMNSRNKAQRFLGMIQSLARGTDNQAMN